MKTSFDINKHFDIKFPPFYLESIHCPPTETSNETPYTSTLPVLSLYFSPPIFGSLSPFSAQDRTMRSDERSKNHFNNSSTCSAHHEKKSDTTPIRHIDLTQLGLILCVRLYLLVVSLRSPSFQSPQTFYPHSPFQLVPPTTSFGEFPVPYLLTSVKIDPEVPCLPGINCTPTVN